MGIYTVEAGSHPVASGVKVKFEQEEEIQPKDGYGAGLKFTFTSIDGPAPGTKCYRTVSLPVKSTNAAGVFVAQMLGVPSLTPATQVDFSTMRGKQYVADIKQSPKSKGSRVESVVLLPF